MLSDEICQEFLYQLSNQSSSILQSVTACAVWSLCSVFFCPELTIRASPPAIIAVIIDSTSKSSFHFYALYYELCQKKMPTFSEQKAKFTYRQPATVHNYQHNLLRRNPMKLFHQKFLHF